MVTRTVVISLTIVSLILVTALPACSKYGPPSIKSEVSSALEGKTISVGKVTVIRYQPEGICARVGIDPAGLDHLVQGFAQMIEEGRHSGGVGWI